MSPWHVFGDRRLTDGDPEFQELAVNPWRSPQQIGVGHRANQLPDIRRNTRPTLAASAFPRPEQPNASTMPGEDGLGANNENSGSPVVPDSRQARPERTVRIGQPHSPRA